MLKKYCITFVLFVALVNHGFAADACGRTAFIEHQEVLVDLSSSQKGEGLRFYLEQDQQATYYLDKYQKNSEIRWQNALLGTAGTLTILTGVFSNASRSSKQNLYITGASLILVNFMVARTLEMTNEQYLNRAIEEYNKRNIPQIHFGPSSSYHSQSSGLKIALNHSWSF